MYELRACVYGPEEPLNFIVYILYEYSISIHINSNSPITNKFRIYVGLFTIGFMNSILYNRISKHFRDKGGGGGGGRFKKIKKKKKFLYF